MLKYFLCLAHSFYSLLFHNQQGLVLLDPTLLNQRNLFPKLLKDLLLVTPKLCTYACRKEGYSYAGVKKEYQCWCGNSTPPSKTLKPDKECNRRCRIDERMFCGANKRMNIYSTADPFEGIK